MNILHLKFHSIWRCSDYAWNYDRFKHHRKCKSIQPTQILYYEMIGKSNRSNAQHMFLRSSSNVYRAYLLNFSSVFSSVLYLHSGVQYVQSSRFIRSQKRRYFSMPNLITSWALSCQTMQPLRLLGFGESRLAADVWHRQITTDHTGILTWCPKVSGNIWIWIMFLFIH